MRSPSLAETIVQDSLNSVTDALSPDVAKDIKLNVVVLVYVWLIQNKSLQKFVDFLKSNGFKNILVNNIPINQGNFEVLPESSESAVTATADATTPCTANQINYFNALCANFDSSSNTDGSECSDYGTLQNCCENRSYGVGTDASGCLTQCMWTNGNCVANQDQCSCTS
jgi:hypothetical protein